MLFTAPELGEPEHRVLEQVQDLKQELRLRLHQPRRWYGSLRRASLARNIQGSNSIEGFDAELDDAAAVELGEETLSTSEETQLALKGYRDAMTFVLQLSNEPRFHYGEQLLKSLHFMMTGYDLENRPGLFRAGAAYVRNDDTGETVYEGANVDDVDALVHELVVQLDTQDGGECPVMVRAAMAHLNLVMIHPFRDGNGRMARCLQTLVLAREQILEPTFCSIEEYLGHNTQAYYDVLAEVGGGYWQPERDARAWVRFTLTAHYRQVKTYLRRIRESEQLWDELENLVARHDLPERTVPVLFDAASGYRVRNATYRAIHRDEISEGVASRDLRALVATDLLLAHGEKRGRYYTRSEELYGVRQRIIDARNPRDDVDPFAQSS
ncbi:MAG: Fic family protein [Acidimicrobiia bacterium]